MFKKFLRKFRANPLDLKLKKLARQNKKRILIEWNRGLGDIALGLYAIVKRINQFIPNAEITFITRADLEDGFSMLENVKVIIASFWKRHFSCDVTEALIKLNLDPNQFDLIIEKPDPTYWVKWQINNLVPKLTWNTQYDNLYQKFPIDSQKNIIVIQPDVGTNYNLWRTLSTTKWQKLISYLDIQKNIQILLVGAKESTLNGKNLLDLRGKTSLLELISILKNVADTCIFLDSGILSLIYYLNVSFSLKVLSLWGDPKQGVLKQNVSSPNPKLTHYPIIGESKNVNSISIERILENIHF